MNSPYITTHRGMARRSFLKAAGVSLALPFLEAMRPSFTWARGVETPELPRRFVGMMTNMGILPQFFFPEKGGLDYASTPYLDILKEHRADMTVFSGVSLPGVDGGHAAERSFLTGAPGASRGSFKNSISLDQVMAEKIGGDTRFPSITVMIGSDNLSLSWTRNGSMIPPQTNPLKLYQQLFVEDTPAGKAAAARRLKEDRSLLDSLRAESKRLERSVGAADRERLDQYFTAVRDLEARLAKAEGWIKVAKPKVAAPAPAPIEDTNDLPKNTAVMLDLLRLALETDSTRIITVATEPGEHHAAHHSRRAIEHARTFPSRQSRGKARRAAPDRRGGVSATGEVSRRAARRARRRPDAAGPHRRALRDEHGQRQCPLERQPARASRGRRIQARRASRFRPDEELSRSPICTSRCSSGSGLEMDKFSSGTSTMRGLELA